MLHSSRPACRPTTSASPSSVSPTKDGARRRGRSTSRSAIKAHAPQPIIAPMASDAATIATLTRLISPAKRVWTNDSSLCTSSPPVRASTVGLRAAHAARDRT